MILRGRPTEPPARRVATAVVIDVLRMTSTAAALMSRPSCSSIAVAATLADLASLSLGDFILISELRDAARFGPRIDNSPAEMCRLELGGRTPVLVTTNGTRTLLAATACADEVFLASFLDLRAVARYVAARARGSVLILPAGHFESGTARIEDDLCADALESLLSGTEPDLAAGAAAIRANPRVVRRIEAEPGFAADLDHALDGPTCNAVLRFERLDTGSGRIVRGDIA